MSLHPHILTALENIYISPLEACNLHCKFCYTNKTKHILSNQEILLFINRYSGYLQSAHSTTLKSILFCGGEVFALKEFPPIINQLNQQGYFISIITNGTIDRLNEFSTPDNCQLIVSLDGPKEIHDHNRGKGNFDKSINFILHSQQLGFPVSIMFVVTPSSFDHLNSFPKHLRSLGLKDIDLTYITVKTNNFTAGHSLSKLTNNVSLTPQQIIHIKQNYPSVPSKSFGCFQLSLQSNGLIYGCCESPTPIASITDHPRIIIDNFLARLNPCLSCQLSKLGTNPSTPFCLGCTDPNFICGYKKELQLTTCQQVVSSFYGHSKK